MSKDETRAPPSLLLTRITNGEAFDDVQITMRCDVFENIA